MLIWQFVGKDLKVCMHDGTSTEVGMIEVYNASFFRRREIQEFFLSCKLSAHSQCRNT